MFRVEIINGSANIETLVKIGESHAFIACVEANEKSLSAYSTGLLADLLLEGIHGVLPNLFSTELPLEMAFSLDKVLARWETEGKELGVVFYTGVLINEKKAHVCTAGDFRSHLLENKRFKAVTRDHNLISDPEQNRFEGSEMKEIYLRTPTRWIGNCPVTPEYITWQLSDLFSVLICSSGYHQYRDPLQYISELKNPADLCLQKNSLIIQIESLQKTKKLLF